MYIFDFFPTSTNINQQRAILNGSSPEPQVPNNVDCRDGLMMYECGTLDAVLLLAVQFRLSILKIIFPLPSKTTETIEPCIHKT
jgi:hypothetical protein